MVCIYCQDDLAVSNSRPQKSRNQTWRRRLCRACGAVFTSIEAIDLSQALIVSYGAPAKPADATGRKAADYYPATASNHAAGQRQRGARRAASAPGRAYGMDSAPGTAPTASTATQAAAVSAASPIAAELAPFDRDRLFISIYDSLRHRPAAASDARALADTVVAQLISESEHGLVAVRAITGAVLNTLRRFDAAAATHYAAFHPM